MPAEGKRSNGGLSESSFDLMAWPLADAEAFLRKRGLAYRIRETKAPYMDDCTESKDFYVVKADIKDNEVLELLVCGKIMKGGAKHGL